VTEANTARILVVDDNEDNRFTLVRRLNRNGYTAVEEAINGRQALELLQAKPFDLVLLDIMMPEMDGYQVLEHLKKDLQLRHIPVIMISAVDEIDSVVKCIELGAEDYLPKPFNPTLLRARIGASLEKKRMRDKEAQFLDQIRTERNRADTLLHAILPPAAVRELKASGKVMPRRFEDVGVLFCDLVGFTAFCDRHPPEQVVLHLQKLVEKFEQIVQTHQLEKIKTIGDAFMASSGLLQPVDQPLVAAIKCGLEMIAAARDMDPAWGLRVGVYQGPLVAGIVGHKQYAFDVWGDTVNVAARLVDLGKAGSVTLTFDQWQDVQHLCRARAMGKLDVKGKGPVEIVECYAVA
jgi:DNA-binding response OmpR family regulator